jgi:hypothetical protein
VGGVLLVAVAMGAGGENLGVLVMASLAILASVVPSVIGTGLGAAALYRRGNHMILATIGFLLSGVHIGALIGLLSFSFRNTVS